jgi:hypothetical protein
VSDRRFIPHPDAERFDAVTIDTVERWKESELSGDEWRFSYSIKFWRHGEVVAHGSGSSVEDALLVAAYQFSRKEVEGPFMGDLSEVCCQPGCPNPWTLLLHPVERYTQSGDKLARPYSENEVRGFCERHKHRGDCGLDDSDANYVVVEERFPPEWAEPTESTQ